MLDLSGDPWLAPAGGGAAGGRGDTLALLVGADACDVRVDCCAVDATICTMGGLKGEQRADVFTLRARTSKASHQPGNPMKPRGEQMHTLKRDRVLSNARNARCC